MSADQQAQAAPAPAAVEQSREVIRTQIQNEIRDGIRNEIRQDARDLREQVREAVRDQLRAQSDQLRAQAEAARAAGEMERAQAMERAADRMAERVAEMEGAPPGEPEVFAGTAEPPFPPWANPGLPSGVFELSIAFFVTCAVIAIGLPLSRAFARRMDRKHAAPAPSADVASRLERIEQAVDTIAIEVERISEGQRFTTKVLSELRALPQPNPLEHAWPQGAGSRSRDEAER